MEAWCPWTCILGEIFWIYSHGLNWHSCSRHPLVWFLHFRTLIGYYSYKNALLINFRQALFWHRLVKFSTVVSNIHCCASFDIEVPSKKFDILLITLTCGSPEVTEAHGPMQTRCLLPILSRKKCSNGSYASYVLYWLQIFLLINHPLQR